MKMYITLKELKSCSPCQAGYKRLMKGIEYEPAHDVRIPLALVYEVCGLVDWQWVIEQLYWQLDVLTFKQFDTWDDTMSGGEVERAMAGSWRRPAGDRLHKVGEGHHDRDDDDDLDCI